MQIGRGKSGVRLGEYGNEKDGLGTLGWIEPACDNPQWILWFTSKGDGLLYLERDEKGGIITDPQCIFARSKSYISEANPPFVSARILPHQPDIDSGKYEATVDCGYIVVDRTKKISR